MTNPFRLLKLYRSADTLVSVLDDGAAKPELYRQQPYWTRVVSAAMALAQNLPLPKGVDMNNFWQKVLIVAGTIVSVGSQVQAAPAALALIHVSPAAAGVFGLVMAVAGGIYHAAPGQGVAEQPAQAAK